MATGYNFITSWQLFPEKCNYAFGSLRKSGFLKFESTDANKIQVILNWVTMDNSAFYSEYIIIPNGEKHPFENQDLADTIIAEFVNASNLTIQFYKNNEIAIHITNEILPNGYLKVTEKGKTPTGENYTNTEVYHKQMSVLPYASSASSVVIKPTEEGAIKHIALRAMEEQTNMQLNQIKEQIELLARQAQDLRKRKELSLLIYEAKLGFSPVIGQTYYMYERNNGNHFLSLISPTEWGNGGPFKQFISAVKLLADHTWMEV